MIQTCAVRGCPEWGEELHHFAPKCLFGSDVAELWPKAYLCTAHHDEWHRVTRTQAVFNHPDLRDGPEPLVRPGFVDLAVWHCWTFKMRTTLAELVAENPQVDFSDARAFPLLDEEDWEGLVSQLGRRRAFSSCLAVWNRAVKVLSEAIPSVHRLPVPLWAPLAQSLIYRTGSRCSALI